MLIHEKHPLGPEVIILCGNSTSRMERVQRKVKSFDTVTKVCVQYVTDDQGRVLNDAHGNPQTTTETKLHYRAVHIITGKEVK